MKANPTPQSAKWAAAQPFSSTSGQPEPQPGPAPLRSEDSVSEQTASEFSGRLRPLCDGRAGLRAPVQIQAQAEASGPARPEGAASLAVIDFVSSDATLDRYDEIISPVGWRLENYRRNPVFQNAHQYGDILFTLGKALITEVRTTPFPHLFQRIEFAIDVNPMARIAYGLYKNKFLNAVSVGFIPIRWENGDGKDLREFANFPDLKGEMVSSPRPSPPGEERGTTTSAGFAVGQLQRDSARDGSPARQARRVYLEQELLEVSAVGIPANPEALQLGLKAGAIERTDLKALLELLRENRDAINQDTNAPAGSIIHHPAHIIPKGPLPRPYP